MMDEERRPTEEEKTYELLSRAEQGLEITTRDDQHDFATFLDAVRMTRRSGGRLRLIDNGRFSVFELEWLAEAGTDIYTSDEARSNKTELELLAKACARGESIIAYFHHGELTGDLTDVSSPWSFLREVGRSGIDIHLSSREKPRDLAELSSLADACRKAGTRVVYYHHGLPEADFEALARAGGWIHLSAEGLDNASAVALLDDAARAASAAGSGIILHLEKGLNVETLSDLLKAGVFLVLKTPPSDRKSALRAIEQKAHRRKLDLRSFYLYTTFLP